MIKVAELILMFVGVFLLLLGAVFVMAVGTDKENGVIGGVLILVAFGILGLIYFSDRIPGKKISHHDRIYKSISSRPDQYTEKELRCSNCGVAIKTHNIKAISGGIMVTCPVCKKVSVLEEQPKW